MVFVRRGGLVWALLVVGTAMGPATAGAQDAEKPPTEDAPTDDAPDDQEPSQPERPDDDEWITPDVAAEQEQDEENAIGDVDEVTIEYGDDETDEDIIKDSEGEEVPDVPVPTVSKTVDVQDPDKLEAGADKETGVQGQVVSRSPKKVLPDAPVLAKGDSDGRVRATITDKRGRYRLYLPPGRYTLRSYYDLYHGARWDDIDVARGKFKRINFVLDPITEKDAGVEEQEVVYLADTSSEQAQLNIRKEQVTVQDAISAQEIKRAGDSTAQGAVKRVVGVTIDEEGRMVIRGLAGRYNQILLNKVPIPGVDPDVPSVKLDIFPSDIVANLSVVKAPVPNLPGAFAGGLLLIDTNNFPRDFQLKVGGSIGGNSLSTFQRMPTYQGGKRDFLGYDDGTRALPSAVGNNRLDVGRAGDGSRYQSRDQVNEVGRQFPNVWDPGSKLAIPKLNLKASMGDTIDLKGEDRRAGYLLSFIYEYDELVRTGYNRRFRYDPEGNAETILQDFDIVGGLQEVLWGTFGSAFLEVDRDNTLVATMLFSRAMGDTTLNQLGVREDTGLEVLTTKDSYQFIGRSIFFNQLTGDHRNLGNTKSRLEWNLSGGTGRRDEPDRREAQQQVVSQLVTTATRYYSTLKQWFVQGQSNVRFPVYEAYERTAYAELGVLGGYQDRDFNARRFVQQQLGNNTLTGDPEVLFDENNLGSLSTIREITQTQDSYVASNRLLGAYAQLETPIAPWLSFLGLMRFEAFTQEVASQSPFAADTNEEVAGTNRTDLDPLPSSTFKFTINKEMFVRLGYGMTVIRPAIRELAPFNYVDFVRGWNITGNPDLLRTRIQNAESRYEYYFGSTDLFAVTAFFKWFDKPIEFVIQNQINSTATFQNAQKAWLVGGELELRLGFARFHEKLDRLYFTGNVALMKSQTTLPDDPNLQISGRLKRQLFNQSPFVTNLSLRFDDPDSGVLVTLVYNVFGPRIVEAGSAAGDFIIPDVYDQTQHVLDLIVGWQPSEHLKVGFKWKNIALAKRRFKQGDELVLLQNFGSSVSIGAEYIY